MKNIYNHKNVSHYLSSTLRIMENIKCLNRSTEQNVNVIKHSNVKVKCIWTKIGGGKEKKKIKGSRGIFIYLSYERYWRSWWMYNSQRVEITPLSADGWRKKRGVPTWWNFTQLWRGMECGNAPAWMSLENITSKISHSPITTYFMNLFIGNIQTRQIYKGKMYIRDCIGLR